MCNVYTNRNRSNNRTANSTSGGYTINVIYHTVDSKLYTENSEHNASQLVTVVCIVIVIVQGGGCSSTVM